MAVVNEHPNVELRKLYAGEIATLVSMPVPDMVAARGAGCATRRSRCRRRRTGRWRTRVRALVLLVQDGTRSPPGWSSRCSTTTPTGWRSSPWPDRVVICRARSSWWPTRSQRGARTRRRGRLEAQRGGRGVRLDRRGGPARAAAAGRSAEPRGDRRRGQARLDVSCRRCEHNSGSRPRVVARLAETTQQRSASVGPAEPAADAVLPRRFHMVWTCASGTTSSTRRCQVGSMPRTPRGRSLMSSSPVMCWSTSGRHDELRDRHRRSGREVVDDTPTASRPRGARRAGGRRHAEQLLASTSPRRTKKTMPKGRGPTADPVRMYLHEIGQLDC